MDRTSLKDQAKAELNPNFSYYLRISLPALLLTAFVALVPFPLNENMHRAGIRVVAHGSRRMMTNGYWNNIAMWQTAVTFIGLLTALLMIGVSFAMIDGCAVGRITGLAGRRCSKFLNAANIFSAAC